MRPRRLILAAALATAAVPGAAHASAYLPPAGKVFTGVTGGDPLAYERAVGKHPAVYQFFSSFGAANGYMFRATKASRTRLMIHISAAGRMTPRAIAAGAGDHYLMTLAERIAASRRVVYIRLMAEMDADWNPYCAYNADGSSRGPAYSTRMFRAAWRRAVLILRGGPVAWIDTRLGMLGMPPVATASAALPHGRVAFLWVPQVAGKPDKSANSPRAYWPGAQYVDWVGTDFYAPYPNWRGLRRFFHAFRGKPFAFGEWALWGADDPRFVRLLFRFVRAHPSVRLVVYNQGNRPHGPLRLDNYPRGTRALRRALSSWRFPALAPEFD